MPIDALSVLYAQLTCDLLAIAKFLYVLKTIADVCSYVDWREISGEFKCLDQDHYLTL